MLRAVCLALLLASTSPVDRSYKGPSRLFTEGYAHVQICQGVYTIKVNSPTGGMRGVVYTFEGELVAKQEYQVLVGPEEKP